MWSSLIRWSLQNRLAVLVIAAGLLLFGAHAATRMTVDVLPDITAPTVTVLIEAPGMAPDEVETLVTIPLETALNGIPGLRRLRSNSGIGLSVIWVELQWGVDPFRARQLVAERLQLARDQLPITARAPRMAPMASIMGEIMFIGLRGDKGISPMTLRDVADWRLRRRLLAIPGVAQVTPIGGELRQVQVLLDPAALRRAKVGHRQVLEALRAASQNSPGGYIVSGHQESLIRGVSRARSLRDLESIAVARRKGSVLRLSQLAKVRFGPAISRGSASIDGQPAVVMTVLKAPSANTLGLTTRIDKALDGLQSELPPGISLYRKGYRQARFIQVAINNVSAHIGQAALLVAIVLALFLMSWRTTLISLTALPLSLVTGVLVLYALGDGLDTMTLGGLAIAIGALVDDAIIDVENVYRRLRQRAALPAAERPSLLQCVLSASLEIRPSIVYATAVIVIVFLPLFFLGGLEGRLMTPLGKAYVISLAASLLVALTVTPVLCYLLLGRVAPEQPRGTHKSLVQRGLEGGYRPLLEATLRHPRLVSALSVAGVIFAIMLLAGFGRSFLPRFSEGSFTITAAVPPGAPLHHSDRLAGRLEGALSKLPFVTSVIRRTGRGELDEHAQDVQFSELEVTVDLAKADRVRAAAELRKAASGVPGLAVSVGQPISHRVEHMLSGVKTSIAVKIFGDDLTTLRGVAREIKEAMGQVRGVVDLAIEAQEHVPQTLVRPRPLKLAEAGITPGELASFVETAFRGRRVGSFWRGQRSVPVVARFPDHYRRDHESLGATPIDIDGRTFLPLSAVARVERSLGPNLIRRENVRRRLVVMANIAGRDIRSVIDEIRRRVAASVKLPPGYGLAYGGEFESEARASRTIAWLSLAAIGAIALLLYMVLRRLRDTLLVMLNLPLSLVGGALVVYASGGVLSIAHLVGFITLFGIATRNGIMLLTHYRHLLDDEGVDLDEAVRRGSQERLAPVLMTALTAALALIPIALAAGQPGNEIQAPMALVILGGLSGSTALNMLVLPTLFRRFAGA